MINGVTIHPLKQIPDERGKIMPMLRNDDKHFEKFGEIYFSAIYPGVIKGWHLHKKMTLNYAVVVGTIKLVLFDERRGSPTFKKLQELFVGESNYALIKIPPGVWNGYKGVGTQTAIIANCATEPHNPQEMERRDPFSEIIPYCWELKHQ